MASLTFLKAACSCLYAVHPLITRISCEMEKRGDEKRKWPKDEGYSMECPQVESVPGVGPLDAFSQGLSLLTSERWK